MLLFALMKFLIKISTRSSDRRPRNRTKLIRCNCYNCGVLRR